MGDSGLRFRTIALAAALLSACSGHQSGTPKSPVSPQVAVFGDSESQLLAQAQAARAAGQDPVWIHVQAPAKEYNFPVYAQLVRNSTALLVRAFGRLYAFPLAKVSVMYGSGPVDLKQLPLVDTPVIDAWLTGRKPGDFKTGNVDQKRSVCPDCLLLVRTKDTIRNITAHWNGKLDPWQVSPTYVAFTPTVGPDNGVPPLSIKPQLVATGGNSCPNAYKQVFNSFTNTLYCYYAGSHYTNYNPYQYPVGGGGGGGAGSTPTPNPGLQPGCSSTSKTAAKALNTNFSSAQAASKDGGEWENMGYIYQDKSGNYYYYDEGNLKLDANGQTTIPNPPDLGTDYTLEGWYHSHPDTYTFDNGNGIDPNGTHFSSQDITTTQQLGVPGFVAEYNDQGPNTGDPSNDPSQESFQWYSTNGTAVPGTSNPTQYSETKNGVLNSSSGC
jgi:hypothetical protein